MTDSQHGHHAAAATKHSSRCRMRFSVIPRPARWAIAAGAAGGAVGLVIGLVVYAPTAAFAALELGVPSAVLGGVAGGIATLATRGYRRMR